MSASPTEPLSATEQSVLFKADRSRIADALSDLEIAPDGAWQPASNVYFSGALDRLKSDGRSVPAAQRVDFARYVAASAFVHAGDAWGYLGRTMDALAKGDVHAAVHLCYYAELRAALSLLASEGIYVSDRVNLVVRVGGDVESIVGSATHRAAWQCLDAWLSTKRAAQLLGKVIQPANTPLSEWIDAMPAGGIRPVVSELLATLTFDLKTFADDRERRNSVSYSPTRLEISDLPIHAAFRMIDEVWDALEPDRPGGFPNLDLELMLEILKSRYLSTTSASTIDPVDWAAWLDGVVPAQFSGTLVMDELKAAPFRTPPVGVVSGFMRRGVPGDHSELIRDMLGRTLLLLRFATGSYAQLLKESTLGPDALSAWIDSLSLARGLWAAGSEPDDVLDLWEDVLIARLSIERVGPGTANIDALRLVGAETVALTQAERVVAWSL